VPRLAVLLVVALAVIGAAGCADVEYAREVDAGEPRAVIIVRNRCWYFEPTIRHVSFYSGDTRVVEMGGDLFNDPWYEGCVRVPSGLVELSIGYDTGRHWVIRRNYGTPYEDLSKGRRTAKGYAVPGGKYVVTRWDMRVRHLSDLVGRKPVSSGGPR
jgi:hypothetical protein